MYLSEICKNIQQQERDTGKPCTEIRIHPTDMVYARQECRGGEYVLTDDRRTLLFGIPVVEDKNAPRLFQLDR